MANFKNSRVSINLLLTFLIFYVFASVQSNFGDHPSADSLELKDKKGSSFWTNETKDGSVRLRPDYDNNTATWTFHFNLLVPESVDNSSIIMYEIEICLMEHNTTTWNFFKKSTQRLIALEYFNQTTEAKRVNVTAICDNAYSGNYSLVIKSCTGSKDDYCSNHGFNETESVQLFAVKTDRIANYNVSMMTMNISMQAISDKGIRVDYLVDYNITSSPLLVEFDKFLTELSIYSNLTEKTKIIVTVQTKQYSIEFRYCPTCNTTNCTDKICDLSSPLESGYYKLNIIPLDSRCNIRSLSDDVMYYNNRKLDTATSELSTTDCIRHITKFVTLSSSTDEAYKTVDVRTLELAHPTLITVVIILFISVVIIVIIVCIRHRKRREQQSQNRETVTNSYGALLLESMGQNHRKVLLIYEIENESLIQQKALILRQRLLAEGVAQVYDIGDESQEEEINTLGIPQWFLERIHDPSVQIVVILSPGLRDYQHRNLSTNPNCLNFRQQLLVYLLDQLMAICVTNPISNSNRIFVLTYSDLEVPLNDEFWLNPFVRYQIPDNFNELLVQLRRSSD